MNDMLNVGSTLGWGQEVREGVAAQCVAMQGLECTGIEGQICVRMQCSLVAFCPDVMQLCALLKLDTGAGVGQTERPSKGHYDVQEGGSGEKCTQNL